MGLGSAPPRLGVGATTARCRKSPRPVPKGQRRPYSLARRTRAPTSTMPPRPPRRRLSSSRRTSPLQARRRAFGAARCDLMTIPLNSPFSGRPEKRANPVAPSSNPDIFTPQPEILYSSLFGAGNLKPSHNRPQNAVFDEREQARLALAAVRKAHGEPPTPSGRSARRPTYLRRSNQAAPQQAGKICLALYVHSTIASFRATGQLYRGEIRETSTRTRRRRDDAERPRKRASNGAELANSAGRRAAAARQRALQQGIDRASASADRGHQAGHFLDQENHRHHPRAA